jgi:hypothetical protein
MQSLIKVGGSHSRAIRKHQRLCHGIRCTKANLLIVAAEQLNICRVESSLFD